jgi:4a-hydroxytetrahydrobiopterin dehydratase
MSNELLKKRCLPCEGGVPALNKEAAIELLKKLDQWELSTDAKEITRNFKFKDYYRTVAFVNAVAWIAHYEGHHPDLEVHYDQCKVRYNTHSVNGLTENDFICAAKVDALFKTYPL